MFYSEITNLIFDRYSLWNAESRAPFTITRTLMDTLLLFTAFILTIVQNVDGVRYVQLKERNPPIIGVPCPAGSRCSWRHLNPRLNPKSVLITRAQELHLTESFSPGPYYYWDDTNEDEVDRIFVYRG